jgi:hypothetical protein
MKFSEIEDLARRELLDEVGVEKVRLVKSWQMMAYANEAEAEACIRARLLVDSTTDEVCVIQTVAGQTVYDYDPRILLITRGKISGAARPLKRVSCTLMDENFPSWEDQAGEVEAFVTGMDKGKIRLFRNPTVDSPLNLTVVRLPLAQMANTSSVPEIHSSYHPSLILWIKHKVYNNTDSELFDKNRADVHLQMFEQKFGQKTANLYDVFDAMQIPQYTPENCYSYDNDGYY